MSKNSKQLSKSLSFHPYSAYEIRLHLHKTLPYIILSIHLNKQGFKMKQLTILLSAVILLGCQQNTGKQAIELNTNIEKVSYSIGVDVGQTFEKQKLELIPEITARGLEDGMKGNEPLLSQVERDETLQKFSEEMMAKQSSTMSEAGVKNKIEGEEFLAANKEKEGVITTASGLQYKVITEGTGRTPKVTDTVETHYRGTLIDGKEFDSSYSRGQPATFPVSGVIKGWTEALLLMKEGAKWQLFIPSDIAYGPRGAGGDIGPNATLIFDIELIAIK
jgi:FKBP-type peptidyl-prolyl cis-trans isomerase FklB